MVPNTTPPPMEERGKKINIYIYQLFIRPVALVANGDGGSQAETPASQKEVPAAESRRREREDDSLAGMELNPMSSVLSSSAPELSGEWHEVRRRRAAAAREHEEREQAANQLKEKVNGFLLGGFCFRFF